MENLTKGIKEKAEKMRYEMLGLFEDMGEEMRSMSRIVKEKTGRISDEIKKRIR
jgi:hypothetical protein